MRVVPELSVVSSLADPATFTGRVWRTDYLRPDDADGPDAPAGPDALSGARFLYEPGARSYWHVHEHEQAIIGVHGRGLVAWEGLDVPVWIGPGDWWHVEPGVPHWHGAGPHTVFAHLAVTAGGATLWRAEVSADDYGRAPAV